MNVLSLFSGIGGLELGLEQAGMTTVGQVEIDPFCRSVLERHWPNVPRHDDVRTAGGWWISSGQRPTVDVVCGGFPCQPFSSAGHKRGVGDERWGWPWMADVIRLVRPGYVVVENVAAILDHDVAFGWMLGDLASLGFDAEWSVLSACAVGAPHTRQRLFLVAYANGINGETRLGLGPAQPFQGFNSRARTWRDRVEWSLETAGLDGRDVDGSAGRLVKAAGNAVVPQVAEYVGRMIMSHSEASAA